MLEASTLPQQARERVSKIYFEAAFRLLTCFDVHEELRRKQDQLEREFSPSNNPQVRHIPHLIGLSQQAERFLYEAKNFLRDISKVLDPFGGPSFDEAKSLGKQAIEWAKDTFGDQDRLTVHLRQNWEWAGHLIQMRNAVEHPGGWSGTLYIENFKLAGTKLVRPTWHLSDYAPAEVLQETGAFSECLLKFTEELLALLVEKHLPVIMQIVEIPATERNPTMPMRLKIDMNPEAWASFNTPSDTTGAG